ncbi:hypothetical protein GCM10009789_61950 [Kribbella sancticallisti]|uniref:Uncharacterized protein n=1 Tax=Kribbella sancticallisti TaxID=460087 RepID=A0ABP4Q6M6_9ACTN
MERTRPAKALRHQPTRPTRPDPGRPDPTQPDPTRPTRADPTRPNPIRPNPIRANPTQPDPSQPDPTRPEPTQPGLNRPNPGRAVCRRVLQSDRPAKSSFPGRAEAPSRNTVLGQQLCLWRSRRVVSVPIGLPRC